MLTPCRDEQSNRRADRYGEKLYLLRRIATEIRGNVPKDFVVGIKLNCADFVDSTAVSSSDEIALRHVGDIVSWGLFDFLEISGGDYESPGSWISLLLHHFIPFGSTAVCVLHAHLFVLCAEFMRSVSKRQAFFSQFSRKIHEYLSKGPNTPLVALTGGFRTYAAMNSALANGHAELIGIGRLSIHNPHVPVQLESEKQDYIPPPPPDYTLSVWDRLFDWLGWLTGIKVPLLMGAGREMCWYTAQLENVAASLPVDRNVSGFGAIVRSIGGVKVRSTNRRTIFSWGSYILFAILLSWVQWST